MSYYVWFLSASSIHRLVLSFMRMRNEGGMALRFDDAGEVMEVLESLGKKKMAFISEVHEMNDSLWIGSVIMPFLWHYKI